MRFPAISGGSVRLRFFRHLQVPVTHQNFVNVFDASTFFFSFFVVSSPLSSLYLGARDSYVVTATRIWFVSRAVSVDPLGTRIHTVNERRNINNINENLGGEARIVIIWRKFPELLIELQSSLSELYRCLQSNERQEHRHSLSHSSTLTTSESEIRASVKLDFKIDPPASVKSSKT